MTAPAHQWPGYAAQFRSCGQDGTRRMGRASDDWGSEAHRALVIWHGWANVLHCGKVAGLCCSDHCRMIHEPPAEKA